MVLLLCLFLVSLWAVSLSERPRGSLGVAGVSREQVFSIQPRSELQLDDSLLAAVEAESLLTNVQAKQNQNQLVLARHPSFRDQTLEATGQLYTFWTSRVPFAQKSVGPIKKSRPKYCMYMSCNITRPGIGRNGGSLQWALACVMPFAIAFFVVAGISLRPQSHGKLAMETGKAVAALLVGLISASIYGHCARDISSLTFGKDLCLLFTAALFLTSSTIATFWFIDIEVARPRLNSNSFLTVVGVVYFLICLAFESVLTVGIDAVQMPHVHVVVKTLMLDVANYFPFSAFLPRGIPLLLWVCSLWKWYFTYFYFWDDTTGDSISLVSPIRFPGFVISLSWAMMQFALPYSRDRYFVGVFAVVLQVVVKFGQLNRSALTEEHHGILALRVAEVFIFILACSIVMRYQIALPSQLQKVKYVRLGYLYDLRRKGQQITRCQEVPDTAFGNPAKVVHLIIVSHHWLDGHTCDVVTPECPFGFRLASICQRLEQFFPSTCPRLSEFCQQPLTIFSNMMSTVRFCDDDVLVFFDFMSLPQIGMMPDGSLIQRTTEEAALFKEILPACGLLYTMFPVLVCPEVSDGVTSYMSSGWCFCEWEQAQLCGTLSPYSEDLEHGSPTRPGSGCGFEFVEEELKEKGFRCEADRDVVRDIVKGTWIRRELYTAVVAQDTEQFRLFLQQLTDHNLQVTIDFPVDSSTLDTLLHITKRSGVSTDIEALLIEYGADPDSNNHRGEKPGQFLIFSRSFFPCFWQ